MHVRLIPDGLAGVLACAGTCVHSLRAARICTWLYSHTWDFSARSVRVGRLWFLNVGAALKPGVKPGVIAIRWRSPAWTGTRTGVNPRRLRVGCEMLRFGCRLARADSCSQLTERGRTRHRLRTDSVMYLDDTARLLGTRSQLLWPLARVVGFFHSEQPESARGCTATRGIFSACPIGIDCFSF
jgi:hypothetical protein